MLSKRCVKELNKVVCDNCSKKVIDWDPQVYTCWIRYLRGVTGNDLIVGTRFSAFESLYPYFRKHICYGKISFIKSKWRGRPGYLIKKFDFMDFPWLIGLYYADGCKKNNNNLLFALSLHEEKIAERVYKDLKKIVGEKVPVFRRRERNMLLVYVNSVELCDYFPDKKNEDTFSELWFRFNNKQKLRFIAGFVDGDGCCAFDVSIEEVSIYSKKVHFINTYFREFLARFGYISVLSEGYKLYCSKKVVQKFREFTIKKNIKRIYHGSVDTKKAFNLLKRSVSINKISKIMGYNEKTIRLALRQVYGVRLISSYSKRVFNPKHSKKRLRLYHDLLIHGYNINQICKKYCLHYTNLRNLLDRMYGQEYISKFVRSS